MKNEKSYFYDELILFIFLVIRIVIEPRLSQKRVVGSMVNLSFMYNF